MDEYTIIDDRIKFYHLLLRAYTCFEDCNYEQAQPLLQCVLDEFYQMFDDRYSINGSSGYVYAYWQRVIYNGRRIPKGEKSSIKTFKDYFHKAMFNITKKHYMYAFSYINDCVTILKNLDSGELK